MRLNNSNWPHILSAMRAWLLGAMAIFPALWWIVHRLWPSPPQAVELALPLAAVPARAAGFTDLPTNTGLMRI